MPDCIGLEVLPHPEADPFKHLVGEERIAALRGLALHVCEFLKGEEGLSAVPTEDDDDPDLLAFAVNPDTARAKLGISGVKGVRVLYPVNSAYFKMAAVEDQLDIKPIFPYIVMRIDSENIGYYSWPEGCKSLPFFGKLAEVLGVDLSQLVLGYAWDEDLSDFYPYEH